MDGSYTTRFADFGRSSFQDRKATAKGVRAWSKPVPGTEGAPPGYLLTWGEHLVVLTDQRAIVLDSGGNQLWSRAKAPRSPVGFRSDKMYYQNADYRLSAANRAGSTVLDSTYLPDAHNHHYILTLFASYEDALLDVIQFTGGPQELPEAVYVERTRYGQRMSDWVWETEARMKLPPLLLASQDKVVVLLDQIVILSSVDGSEIARWDYPVETPFSAVADRDGTIYLAGTKEGQTVLAAVDPSGAATWRWTDEIEGRPINRTVPPILAADGTVFLFSGPTLLAVKNGQPAWEYTNEGSPLSFGTALADGSLLATAGNRLIRLRDQGAVEFTVELDAPPVSPPVVDSEGYICVIAGVDIVKIK